ncbi:gamma-glutamyltranspeptidase [Gorgonomyces haynaldii]|nr:gamma-glutamyltranspeptidase [Gorgonomyces haynaldii]
MIAAWHWIISQQFHYRPQGTHAAVASENDLCTVVGLDTLKAGGSAIDSAIATTFCIGVTNMYSSGIGGGGFMLHRSEKGDYTFLDFREAAPSASKPDMFVKNPMNAQFTGLASGVPGEVIGLWEMHKLGGKLPWKQLIVPAERLAANGWKVTPLLEKRIQSASEHIFKNAAMQQVFAPKGKLLVAGDWISRPTLALTLRDIGEQGPDVFYKGYIADELIRTINGNGGNITKQDFLEYMPLKREPVVGFYKGKKVVTGPPPSSGPVLMSVLKSLDGLNYDDSSLSTHRLVELFKHGYAQRGFIGDPVDPVYRNITSIYKQFLSQESVDLVRSKVNDDKTFDPKYYDPEFQVKDTPGTMHISILTANGEAVTLTSTVNLLFGSKIMDQKTGIILNNEMDDFSIPGTPNAFGLVPSPYNYVHPHKRPLSSSVPTIVEEDGQVLVVAGASGGSQIITATVQVILGVLDLGLTALQAVDAPRMHHQLLPHFVTMENTFSSEKEEFLRDRGHQIMRLPPGVTVTGVAAISNKNGLLVAGGDKRKDGFGAAY